MSTRSKQQFLHFQKIADQVGSFPTYNASIRASTERDIAETKKFPVVDVVQQDGTLLRQATDAFIRDFMLDSDAVGWFQELRGSPPVLVIKVLRIGDFLDGPIKED